MVYCDEKNNYDLPVEIAQGIYWAGDADSVEGLHCNPYLIIEEDEAIVIDGGSRPDFSSVMMRILQTGLDPSKINNLIYQHYDPDLCGSLPHFENIIGLESLKIISHYENNLFIAYYGAKAPLVCIESDLNFSYSFKTGRTLTFVRTPYSHSTGSFVTFDNQTGVLFSSDLFGSYSKNWDLFLNLSNNSDMPEQKKEPDPLEDISIFHRRVMTSDKALHHALDRISVLPITTIAPQHGSIINKADDIKTVTKMLKNLKGVGIDRVIQNEN